MNNKNIAIELLGRLSKELEYRYTNPSVFFTMIEKTGFSLDAVDRNALPKVSYWEFCKTLRQPSYEKITQLFETLYRHAPQSDVLKSICVELKQMKSEDFEFDALLRKAFEKNDKPSTPTPSNGSNDDAFNMKYNPTAIEERIIHVLQTHPGDIDVTKLPQCGNEQYPATQKSTNCLLGVKALCVTSELLRFTESIQETSQVRDAIQKILEAAELVRNAQEKENMERLKGQIRVLRIESTRLGDVLEDIRKRRQYDDDLKVKDRLISFLNHRTGDKSMHYRNEYFAEAWTLIYDKDCLKSLLTLPSGKDVYDAIETSEEIQEPLNALVYKEVKSIPNCLAAVFAKRISAYKDIPLSDSSFEWEPAFLDKRFSTVLDTLYSNYEKSYTPKIFKEKIALR